MFSLFNLRVQLFTVNAKKPNHQPTHITFEPLVEWTANSGVTALKSTTFVQNVEKNPKPKPKKPRQTNPLKTTLTRLWWDSSIFWKVTWDTSSLLWCWGHWGKQRSCGRSSPDSHGSLWLGQPHPRRWTCMETPLLQRRNTYFCYLVGFAWNFAVCWYHLVGWFHHSSCQAKECVLESCFITDANIA